MTSKYLALDVGGTNIKYGLIDRTGKLLEKNSIKSPHNLNDFIIKIQRVIDHYSKIIRGVAFSIPGRIEHEKNVIHGGGSLPFLNGLSLSNLFRCSVPISIENDGKAAALAELWLGNLKDISNGAAIVLGTGVGGGLILNHQLFYGTHSQAGEISFLLNKNEDISYENLEGSSGSAVKMINKITRKLGLDDLDNGKAVFSEINKNNRDIMPIFEDYCRNIAVLIHNIQGILDLDCYVIGGGISSQVIVTETINKEFDKIRNGLPIIKTTLLRPKISDSKFKNDANLYGALYHWLLEADENMQNKRSIV